MIAPTRPLLISLMLVSLTACQSTPALTMPVIARADKTFETIGLGKSKTDAQSSALHNAKSQCGRHTPIVITDELIYNGVMDEHMGRVLENGMNVVGAILGTKSPNLNRDDDYEYHIKFRCE